ncbi:Yip1 family protein [Aliiroseovarius subalbicans]|uniref:Yip1 family protein n=1 Tax=Aliiroseovarius subalbicans TaxID=2925840 RepID=UPI001F58539A|nr:Yip1 family protein [Aliiroseovarius subalbicans]MCI2398401.1 YIP1 family protein [Aliiroseovarius subalbicans]
MKFEFGYLFGMALQSIPEPRKVARDLFALNLPRDTLWLILMLLITIGAVLGTLASLVFPVEDAMFAPFLSNHIALAVVEGGAMFVITNMLYLVGRAFGGQGTLEQALVTVIWLEFVTLVVQVGILVLSLFAPALAVLLWLAGGVAFFWIISHFTAEMHGFKSVGLVFAALIVIVAVFIFVLSIFLAILGVGAGQTGLS